LGSGIGVVRVRVRIRVRVRARARVRVRFWGADLAGGARAGTVWIELRRDVFVRAIPG
jgi:hypothetical protein